jgi:hypothetical protein
MRERELSTAWPLAISLQGRVANHRERLASKASVVSVAEKVPQGIRWGPTKANTRELPFKCRNNQMTSKPGVDVGPGSAWRRPAYWPCGVRHRGSASAVRAPMLNCGNLRLRCQRKDTSGNHEADSTDARSRGGAARSSDEVAVMAMEQRGRVSTSWKSVNCESRRSRCP